MGRMAAPGLAAAVAILAAQAPTMGQRTADRPAAVGAEQQDGESARTVVNPPTAGVTRDEALGREIAKLFAEDQDILAGLAKAEQDPGFARASAEHRERVLKEHPPNFYIHAVNELWASEPDAPDIVRKYMAFRQSTTRRLKEITAQRGWPRRAIVGDEPAVQFYFLFGHADEANPWRRTQMDAIRDACRADRIDMRLYAHLRDRIEALEGKPQVFGTVMGPSGKPGEARLYCPIVGAVADADKRRAEIGLPTVEEDLGKFRKGARIGPYMKPITKDWSIAEAYIATPSN